MTDELKKAETRGYRRGYVAGRKKRQDDNWKEKLARERQAFLDRAFISVLPAALNAKGWKFGDKPITSTQDRVELAARWAAEALKRRPFA